MSADDLSIGLILGAAALILLFGFAAAAPLALQDRRAERLLRWIDSHARPVRVAVLS
jgi:hypothetical protein